MTYTQSSFDNCKYNPLIKDFKTKYKELFKMVPDSFVGDSEKLLRYVCLMYDPKSPLIQDSASIEMRQRSAAQYAGYDLAENLESIFELSDLDIIDVIDTFLKVHIHERLWYMICVNERTFYEYGKRSFMPIKWDEGTKEQAAISIKTKLSEDMASINERIESDYRILYLDDIKLQKVVTKKRMTPESVSKLNGK